MNAPENEQNDERNNQEELPQPPNVRGCQGVYQRAHNQRRLRQINQGRRGQRVLQRNENNGNYHYNIVTVCS